MKQSLHALLFVFGLFFCSTLSADTKGTAAIATAHTLATAAGKEVLLQGGNAFDAAVAISAALAVVEPFGSGIGGGGFWLLHIADQDRSVMIDGRETAPSRAHKRIYLDKTGQPIKEKSLNGPTAAAIPGTVAALEHISKRYGKLALSKLLQPAIRYAKDGFSVTERYQKLAEFRRSVMQQYPAAAEIFLDQGNVPRLGHKIIQTDLAATLQSIAERGSEAFYRGEIAKQMVKDVIRHGGFWELSDLAAYRVVEREPVVFQYHDMKITSAPLPSSGGIVLAQSLGILQQFKLRGMDPTLRKHIVSEAMRRAYRDRAAYLGDSDFVEVPVDRLLDSDYIHGLAVSIDSNRASDSNHMGRYELDQTGTNTTHFSVMDKMGNRVSATLSINLPFGSGFVASNTGVLLNDEMDDFTSKSNTANAYGLVGEQANLIQPGKRPLSSMSPTFIETENKIGILGTPGGSRIISMVLLGILDFAQGHFPASWVSVPRYHHQYLPDEIQFEKDGLTDSEIKSLQSMGHNVSEKNRQYGNMQAIMFFKPTAYMMAASDPRGEGEAIVFQY